jgi:hypothetical protein
MQQALFTRRLIKYMSACLNTAKKQAGSIGLADYFRIGADPIYVRNKLKRPAIPAISITER